LITPTQGNVILALARRMTVDRLVRDVQPDLWQAFRLAPRAIPGEPCSDCGIVSRIRRHGVTRSIPDDGLNRRCRCAPVCSEHLIHATRGARRRCRLEAAGRDAVNCFETIVVLLSPFDADHNQAPISFVDCAPDGLVTA
jgi:hypothetical protein